MEEIPWIPEQVAQEFRRENLKLLATTVIMFGLGVLSFLGSSQAILNAAASMTVVSLAAVSILFMLFGFYYLKRALEHKAHTQSLIYEQERVIANSSLLLLAEIEIELNR